MQYPQLELASVKGPQATIKTNLGEIKIQLFEKQAPKTVNNFVQLAEKRLLRWGNLSPGNS